MQGFGKLRVIGDPIGERLDRMRKVIALSHEIQNKPGPPRKTASEFVHTIGFRGCMILGRIAQP